MVTPVQQSAVDDIRNKLNADGLFNTVTHGEVNDVAARLKGLNAADADAVIDELQRTGQLDRLAQEGVDGSIFGNGGYSNTERTDLFNDLAGKLDGQSLASLSNAFARTDQGGQSGFDRVGEIGNAIATHGSAQAKLDYVRAVAPDTVSADGKPSTIIDTQLFAGATTRSSDAEANAAATVLGSLRGSYAEQGFQALRNAQQPGGPDPLRAVLAAGVDQTSRSGQASVMVDWNTQGYTGVMDAAASIVGNQDLKAQIFDASADTLRSIRDTPTVGLGINAPGRDEALASVRDGMTKLLDSNTTGIVRELAYNGSTMDGADLSAYSEQMIATGQEAKLGELMTRLQTGNSGREDPIQRLDQVTTLANGQTRRENAGALGYFVGSVYSGAQAHSTDVKAQQEAVTGILDSALTIFDKSAAGRVVAGAYSIGKEWTQYAVRAAINDPGTAPATRLERAALPVDPSTKELGVGDDVRNAFNTALSGVQRSGNP